MATQPKQKILTTGSLRMVAGLQVQGRCSRCAKPTYLRSAPCFMRRAGWKTVRRCIACGNLDGVERATPYRA